MADGRKVTARRAGTVAPTKGKRAILGLAVFSIVTGVAIWQWHEGPEERPRLRSSDADSSRDAATAPTRRSSRSREEPVAPHQVMASASRPDGRTIPCHDAELTAAAVPVESVTGQPDAATGGVLTDGTYDVSNYHVFGVPPPGSLEPTFSQTIVFEANGTRARTIRIDVGGGMETTTWSVETAGNVLTVTGVCPAGIEGDKLSMEYGMRGDELVTRVEQAGHPVVVTYQRRGDG